MVQGRFVQFSAYDGPSVDADFAAAVAELDTPPAPRLAVDRVKALLDEQLPEALARSVVFAGPLVGYVELAAALASALQDIHGACDLPVKVEQVRTGRTRILLGYHDVQTALHALRGGLEIADALLGHIGGAPAPRRTVESVLKRIDSVMALRQPDYIARSLIRVARARSMPVYPLAPGARVWQYGQGSAGVHFFEAANQHDSPTGARIARDKYMTNVLIRRLGLPGVEHEVVSDLETARRVAERYGFPLVVKPIDQGKGRGVTANIRTREAFERAYARAARDARRGVLVERFVEGEDHRLSVFGGRLCFASRRSSARVIGDGVQSIVELIEQENARRSDADVAAGFTNRLIIDGDMLNTLAGQGLGPADRPEHGRVVVLRTMANVATGGTITDVTPIIHPHNRDLAETIARAFRMDALGLDFLTPDITRSWHEVRCAVIEINATPGFGSDERAERILEAKFPGRGDGRIPSVVLVGADRSDLDAFAGELHSAGLATGDTDGSVTRLGSETRCAPTDLLPARVMALLLDPACQALVIAASVAEIERHGFPLDRCDLAVVAGDGIDEGIERLVRACSTTVILAEPGRPPARVAAAGVQGLLARRSGGARREL